MNLIYITLGVTWYYFSKNSLYVLGRHPYTERITSIVSKINPCAFIPKLAMNLIYIFSGGYPRALTKNL